MYDDYEPGDEFDWDRNDSRQYCEHGTFIGSWWGPDILCGWCEQGVSAAEADAIEQAIRERDRANWIAEGDRSIAMLRECGVGMIRTTVAIAAIHGFW